MLDSSIYEIYVTGDRIFFSRDVVLGTSLETMSFLLTYCADVCLLIPSILATEVVFWAVGFQEEPTVQLV